MRGFVIVVFFLIEKRNAFCEYYLARVIFFINDENHMY